MNNEKRDASLRSYKEALEAAGAARDNAYARANRDWLLAAAAAWDAHRKRIALIATEEEAK